MKIIKIISLMFVSLGFLVFAIVSNVEKDIELIRLDKEVLK